MSVITWDDVYRWSAEEMRAASRDPKKREEIENAIAVRAKKTDIFAKLIKYELRFRTPMPVISRAQNKAYTKTLLELELRSDLTPEEKQYTDVLAALIEKYEQEKYPDTEVKRGHQQSPASKKKIYVIGSLRGRKKVMAFANELRKQGFEVFDDWTAPGPEADLFLWKYYKQRGFTYEQMIQSYAARNNYLFDRRHLDEADAVILYGKGGKSAHLELGYSAAKKPSFLFMEKPPIRPDIMLAFLFDSGGGIFFDRKKLFEALKKI